MQSQDALLEALDPPAQPINEKMLVAALLPPVKLQRVRNALNGRCVIVVRDDQASFAALFAAQPVNIVLIDPFAVVARVPSGRDPTRFLEALAVTSGVTIILYLDAHRLRDILHVVWSCRARVVLWGIDDSPEMWRDLLETVAAKTVVDDVLQELAPAMEGLLVSTRSAIHALFREPARFRSVGDVSLLAGVHRRTLERELHEAGLSAPRDLMAAARVSVAYGVICGSNGHFRDAARHLRSNGSRGLRRDLERVTGRQRPLDGIQDLDRSAFVDCVVHFINARHTRDGSLFK